jgi:tripartite-type tricarboxylate transporter receptor subunit TctC
MRRRDILAGLLALAAGPAAAQGQGFPNRPIRLIAPFGAGSTVDLMARAVAGPLAELLGQPVVVENRGGAGGNLGVDTAAKAPPDGHALAIGTSGIGSTNHLAGEVFRAAAGVEITHVPYRGNAEMMNDLLGGQLQMLFSGIPPVLPLVQDGRVRVLAVSGPKRLPAIPEVPTMAEAGLPGAEAISFYGIVAPAGTPVPVLAALNGAVGRALARPDVRAAYAALGSAAEGSTPEEFGRLIAEETAKWRAVIERIGLKPQ